MDVTPEILAAQERLSPVQRRFAEFFLAEPACRDPRAWDPLAVRDDFLRFDLQRWQVFLGPEAREELARATTAVCRLVREIPRSIFGLDPGPIADWYGFPREVVSLVTAWIERSQSLPDVLARADLIWTAQGLKTCEVNASGNLGGWEVGSWASRYRQVEPLGRFLDGLGDGVALTDPFDRTFEHLVRLGLRHGLADAGTLNLAIQIEAPVTPEWGSFVDRSYRAALAALAPGLDGRAIIAAFPDAIAERGGRLSAEGHPVHLVIDTTPWQAKRALYAAVMAGRALILNGPVAAILSHKSNLALLSELEAAGELAREDAEAVRRYVPWTRRVSDDFVDFEGERTYLPDLLVERREDLVLKASLSMGGADVHLGRTTPPPVWRQLAERAAAQGGWIVQQLAASLPYLLGDAEGRPEWHDVIWGTFAWGAWGDGPVEAGYHGAFLRHKPCAQEGIINAAQGATIGLYWDVPE